MCICIPISGLWTSASTIARKWSKLSITHSTPNMYVYFVCLFPLFSHLCISWVYPKNVSVAFARVGNHIAYRVGGGSPSGAGQISYATLPPVAAWWRRKRNGWEKDIRKIGRDWWWTALNLWLTKKRVFDNVY